VENSFRLGNLGIIPITDLFGGFDSDRHVVHDIAPRDADLIVIDRCGHDVLERTPSGAAVSETPPEAQNLLNDTFDSCEVNS
jgi:hypothetical protein